MLKKIIYKKNYIPQELVEEVRNYFYSINDALDGSAGPKQSVKSALGWIGCWDRQLHYELEDNPIHKVISKLKEEFGDFSTYDSSIRYLSAPFMPHSDIRNPTWLKQLKANRYREGFTFLIPLSWKSDYTPGTAFFNSPPNVKEPLYNEMLDILPKYSSDYEIEQMNFSVREIIKWESPGDLIAWENFQWHSSCHFGNPNYQRNDWIKEFISIETYFKKQ
jgi:hypothetical protein